MAISLFSLIYIFIAYFPSDPTPSTDPDYLLLLNPSMIINEKAFGNADALVDEQNIPNDKIPQSAWHPGWIDKNYYPLSVVIDLGEAHHITHISLFDGQGKGDIIVRSGKPFQWDEEFTYGQTSYNTWFTKEINKNTRFIQIEVKSGIIPYEVKLYGYPTNNAEKTTQQKRISHIERSPMDRVIGINAFIDDPIDKIKVASFVREYHNWGWDALDTPFPNNIHAWNPSNAGGGWNFDKYYKTLTELRIEVVPCLKGNAKWISATREEKPLHKNAHSTDPASYIAHADYMFQYAARYGNNKVDEKSLKLKDNQEKKSGLNHITYIENWNEQDKTWEGVSSYFTPYEYAAMTSADYDGHQNFIKGNVGVKNADPNLKMAMGGLAGLDLEYIRSIKFWSDHHREGSLPFDIINLHHYSRKGKGENTVGICPEEDSLRAKLEEIVAYRNKHMPDKDIWITEFGYDTHPASPQRAPKIKNMSSEEVQAQWLVRSYLEIAAAGIDRAAMYMLRDVDPESSTKYATSGLTSDKKSGWKPKTSWYYVYSLKNILKNMLFKESKIIEGVYIYEFYDINNKNKKALAVWSPTSEAKVIHNFDIQLNANIPEVDIVTLKHGTTEGISKPLEVKEGSVSLTISERPIFVIWNSN